jgi:hypothetical protein
MNKNNEDLKVIPYTATSLSVIGRFIFMFCYIKIKVRIVYLSFFVF